MPSIDLGNVVGPKGDKGDTGPQGIQGIQGIQGQTGPGVSPGGTENSFLAKNSTVDYDTKWMTLPQIGSELVKPDNPVGSALFGKASNPNLLNNWYFPDPINQRGQTEYVSVQYSDIIYTIDRWYIVQMGSQAKVNVSGNGLEVSFTPGGVFGQRFCIPFLYNKIVTFSLLTQDGQLIVFTDTFPQLADTANNIYKYIEYKGTSYTLNMQAQTDGNSSAFIYSNSSTISTLPIVAVKLELGPVQTLAHQDADGNWVLNDPPPNKALELAKCQRYQLAPFALGYNQGYVGPLITNGDSKFFGMLFTPTTMRTHPVIENLDLSSLRFWTGKGMYYVTSLSVFGYTHIGVQIEASIDGQFEAGESGFIYKLNNDSTPFILSCNL